jgi:hypothetical protein
MLHPLVACDTAARQKKAMLAQAATIAQARTAQHPGRASRGRPVSRLVSGARLPLRPRTA